jgi:hypothetical protein
LAKAIGEEEVAGLLSETLEEEKMTDMKLTEVTQQSIMPEALGSDSKDEGEVESPNRKKASGGRTKAA